MKRTLGKDIRNLVVKVGTSVLTKNGRFDKTRVSKVADEVSGFLKKGVQVSIVSSGAIGAGMTLLNQKTRPSTMEGLQAAAAIGQRYLMQCWEEGFSKYGHSTAQVLLTRDDLIDKKRRENAKKTLNEIQRLKHVPIVNENDTVATEEIKFGDNDRLSAMLAEAIQADHLVILSDTDGLYDDRGKRIREVRDLDESIFAHVNDKKSDFTVGGMKSKLEAIRSCTKAGISVTLTSGTTTNLLRRIERNEPFGTRFFA